MRLIDRLRQLRHRHRAGTGSGTGLHGHIDGVIGRELVGWAHDPARPGPLTVGLFTPLGLVATAVANRDRADVRAAGFGDGKSGFAFPLDDDVLAAIAQSGPRIEVRILGRQESLLAEAVLPGDFLQRAGVKMDARSTFTPLGDPLLEKCRARLFGELEILRVALRDTAMQEMSADTPGDHALHQKLFAPQTSQAGPAPHETGHDAPPPLPAYLDFARYRYRVDREFATDTLPEERAHFLDWYLQNYGAVRQGRRIPLARETIAYLNAPITMGGQRESLTRAMWWQLSRQPDLLANMRRVGEKWQIEAFYWWVNEAAPRLGAEDCLVPDFVADQLRLVEDDQHDQPWPLSLFIHRFYRDTPSLHFLDGGFVRDRELLSLSLMLMALRRPGLLRYVPARTLQAAFAPQKDGSAAPFEAFLRDLMPDAENFSFSEDIYAQILWHRGFDYRTRRFLSIDAAGHRYHAAALPVAPGTEVVDVQMIGPFEKASGLGQATRLSAAAMETTGLGLNKVNFGLDNPAPEGFSTATEHGSYKRARINLIHLNAESVPNAFAYEPDVFNGAYNIGYFFWELDTPAACHSLSFELLDEIWVSSQYGVEIYQPHAGIPVRKLGMCFEDIPHPSREEARAFLRDRLRIKGETFVFLVTFDSFSFVQRKNPVGVLRAFLKAFDAAQDVCLIVKTQNRDHIGDPAQQRIWQQVDSLLARDSRIHLLNETLSYNDLIRLKKGADAYISLHRSEGWGFGMIEAMNLGVPVICTGYSGNMEFCSDDTAWLVDYHLVELEPDDYIFVRQGQKWAEPDIADAARQMRAVREDPAERERRVQAARRHVRENFSARAIGARYEARLREILDGLQERAPHEHP